MPDPLAGDAVVSRKEAVAFVDGGSRTIVLDLDRLADPPVVLEGSGRMMWDALARPRSVDALVADVAAYYAEDVATVRPAVVSFLTDLVSRGLVHPG